MGAILARFLVALFFSYRQGFFTPYLFFLNPTLTLADTLLALRRNTMKRY